MKKMIAVTALLFSVSAQVHGRDIFDKMKYREVALSDGTKVLVNSFTGKVEWKWIVPASAGMAPQEEEYLYPASAKPFWCPLSGQERR